MHIVHLLPYFAPAWSFGGVVRAAHGLATALAGAGCRLTVITTDAGDGGLRLPTGWDEFDGLRVCRCRNVLPSLRRLNLSSPRGLRRVLRGVLPDADVLHVHEFRTMENLLALPLAQRCGVPVALSPHGTLPYTAGRPAIKRGWDALLGRGLARRIDTVAALTAAEAADARALWGRFGLSEAQTAIVPNGVNPAEFAALPARDVFRGRWDIPADAPLMLFLGRLHERKGAQHLLDALPDLPGAWLALVGPDEGQRAALEAQAARLGVAGRAVFTGLLTGDDKLAALAAADVLALPAVGEGLPMVALEALAAGLPVALSDECHLPEVFAAGAGLRLDALNGPGVAAALRPLLVEPSVRGPMGAQGRALVAERFTWAAVAGQMIALYKSLRQHTPR